MKTPTKASSRGSLDARSSAKSKNRGFALVVTLSLMILLTILAVGLLSLSSVSLRSSSQGASMAEARANARLALMMALGDLQRNAGPDQRVTAPAGVLGASIARQRITGVWQSKGQDHTSQASDFNAAGKSSNFKRWLVSNPDSKALDQQGFASGILAPGKTVVDLVSEQRAAAPLNSVPALSVSKVPVTNLGGTAAQPRGRYAYAVLDEGVKARVNIGRSMPSEEIANASTALGSGQRPGLDRIDGIADLPPEDVNLNIPSGRAKVSSMVTVASSEFAYNTSRGAMKAKFNDLTSDSLGLLTDVVNGGFKKDFNLLAETQNSTGGLPPDYKGKKIYQQSFASKTTSIVSDPSWDRALAFANLFNGKTGTNKDIIQPGTAPGSAGLPTINATIPQGWFAGTGKRGAGANAGPATLSNIDPPGPVLLPSIAKIQMSFSLAARDVYRYPRNNPIPWDTTERTSRSGKPDMHGPWDKIMEIAASDNPTNSTDGNFLNGLPRTKTGFDYLLHLVFSPIITLHNPYNLPITFKDLKVEFVNVPFSFRVTKNGTPQTKELVPFSIMYDNSMNGGVSKRFGITLSDGTIKEKITRAKTKAITLLPGEVKVFSPNIDPEQSWAAEVAASSANKLFWDWSNRNSEDSRNNTGTMTDTSQAVGIPGWFGPQVGYDLDFLNPNRNKRYANDINTEIDKLSGKAVSRWGGIILNPSDELFVEFAPLPDPMLPDKKFTVEMTLNATTGLQRSSVLEFDFGKDTGLQEKLMANHPQSTNKKTIRYPEGNDLIPVINLFDHSLVKLGDIKNTVPFAMFSVYARNTSGGSNANGAIVKGSDAKGEEGIWSGKPFSFQNQASPAISQNLITTPPAGFSHEIDLSRFPTKSINIQGGTNRGTSITGLSGDEGRRFGVIHEIPLAPLQNFGGLNGALLGAGNRLPHFSSPIGNSYSHPLIPTSDVVFETGAAGYAYADHSFLLNAALFDSYYFSGFQTRAKLITGGDGISAKTLIDEFFAEPDTQSPKYFSPLTDKRLVPYIPQGSNVASLTQRLNDQVEGYKIAATAQLIEGPFNVNSISVDAWKAMLSSMPGTKALALVAPGSQTSLSNLAQADLVAPRDNQGARFSRFRLPNGQSDRMDSDGFWRGPVDLSKAQLDNLAKEIVKQVRSRGPFLSMAEFVNRKIGDSLPGALQTAIDDSGVNKDVSVVAEAGSQIGIDSLSEHQLSNAKALEGDSAQGAPGFLMQQDLLSVLGNAATVRSDTFVIRSYGESLDATGNNVLAVAYCEAVVQRMPEYVDPTDAAAVSPATTKSNLAFGRRFNIVSFRWLSKEEI